MELSTEKAIIKATLSLVEMDIEIAVISRGKHGNIAATKERIFKAVAPPVKVRSAVGAGDCTIAGFALKLAKQEPLLEACRLAVAMGTAAVLTPGTELCRRADVEELLPQIKVWKMALKEWCCSGSIGTPSFWSTGTVLPSGCASSARSRCAGSIAECPRELACACASATAS